MVYLTFAYYYCPQGFTEMNPLSQFPLHLPTEVKHNTRPRVSVCAHARMCARGVGGRGERGADDTTHI